MSQPIYIHNQEYVLDASDFIQSGGEGMVFGLANTAVKIYHHLTPLHQAKLRYWFAQSWSLPPDIVAPSAPVYDSAGQLIGVQMARLPAGAEPLKRLSQPHFWQQHSLTLRQVVPLFKRLHHTLSRLHRQKIIVGDLNETNIFFTQPFQIGGQLFWIDVDSYQFGHFPCPVAKASFLDPTLYHVTDFAKRPYFTHLTDWYAFAVLLFKSLLHVHPYGGVHRQHKSVEARAALGLTTFEEDVTLPPGARPSEILSDDLLHYLHRVFAKGERRPFPAHLLDEYVQNLRACAHCQLEFPASRSGCPACSHPSPVPARPPATGTGWRRLLQVDGFIERVFMQPDGRLLIIWRQGDQYKLARAGIGGTINQMALFSAAPGYRFGRFISRNGGDILIVNPPHSCQLLLLDVQATEPQQVTLLETGMFGETAAFATTFRHLYRLSGGWIMRGTMQRGSYLEEPVGTAHQSQTQLFADPYSEHLAGFHRYFAQHHFFTLDPDGTERPLPVILPANSQLTQATFAFCPNQIGTVLKLVENGRSRTQVQRFSHRAEWRQSWESGEDAWETAVNHFPQLPQALPCRLSSGDRLLYHQAGFIIQQPRQLIFVPRVA